MKQGSVTLHFTYDSIGPATVIYRNGSTNRTYYYLKNAQGDVYGITSSSGSRVVSYSYDTWGKLLSSTDTTTSHIGSLNPLRYRGYVYDNETGFYYVSSRYYNPDIYRFINIDTVNVLSVAPTELANKNLFAYCDNNPINRQDGGGEFWNYVTGALIGGTISVLSAYATAKITGESMSLTDVAISFATGAVSGILTASPLCKGAIIAINSTVAFAGSVLSDVHNGRKIDYGKAMLSAGVAAASSVWGGNGIRNAKEPYAVANTALSAAKNSVSNASCILRRPAAAGAVANGSQAPLTAVAFNRLPKV